MRTKLRVVKLQNGQYQIQVKCLMWFDFFWHTLEDFDKINGEDRAREDMQRIATAWSRPAVVAIIEERTL